MVLRIYLDGANVGRSRTLQVQDHSAGKRNKPPPIDPKQIYVAAAATTKYFRCSTSHGREDPAHTFTFRERGRSGKHINIYMRVVFSESTLNFLVQGGPAKHDNKYMCKLREDCDGIFLKAPNREDDDCWLLSRAQEDYASGDTVVVVSGDNYDVHKEKYPSVVPRCLMKYCYDEHEHRFTLKSEEVLERIDREFFRCWGRSPRGGSASRSVSRSASARRGSSARGRSRSSVSGSSSSRSPPARRRERSPSSSPSARRRGRSPSSSPPRRGRSSSSSRSPRGAPRRPRTESSSGSASPISPPNSAARPTNWDVKPERKPPRNTTNWDVKPTTFPDRTGASKNNPPYVEDARKHSPPNVAVDASEAGGGGSAEAMQALGAQMRTLSIGQRRGGACGGARDRDYRPQQEPAARRY